MPAISRAKDELVDPARYLALGQAMLAVARDDAAQEAAEKAIEVAGIYAAYEEILKLARVERDLEKLVQALLDGVPAAAVKVKMQQLEAQKSGLLRLLQELATAELNWTPSVGPLGPVC